MTEEGPTSQGAPQPAPPDASPPPGATPPAAPPAAPARPLGQQIREFLGRTQSEPTGLLAALLVLIVCAVVSLIGWIPLSWPAQFIDGLLPDYYNWCGQFETGSIPMYGCSALVGALAAAGSLVIVIALFVLRRPIAAAFRRIAAALPEESRFLVGPVAGTLAFTIAWAGTHFETAGQAGFLPQPIFPAMVGLFLYAVARWGAPMQRVLGPLLAGRDRFPIGYRVLAAIAVPLAFSLLMGNQSDAQAALKGQVVAMVALISGYVALMPRTGSPLAGIERTLREMGAP